MKSNLLLVFQVAVILNVILDTVKKWCDSKNVILIVLIDLEVGYIKLE